MLKSNWSLRGGRDSKGDHAGLGCKESGRAYVIRQRIGLAAPRKSQAVHKYMSDSARSALAAKLEREAAKN